MNLKNKIKKRIRLVKFYIYILTKSSKLRVAYITPYERDYRDFWFRNRDIYNITHISKEKDLHGRTFDLVIYGYRYDMLNDVCVIIKHYLSVEHER